MPAFLKLTDDLCLVEQEISEKKTVTKRNPVNHLWVYDRSGSMAGLLPELCTQLIDLSKKLPPLDSLSLGWFSGEGDFNWVIKGFKITDKSDFKFLAKAIKDNSSSRGTTCFSEILKDTETVIKDLSALSKTFSFHFFTDGFPVVGDYNREVSNIFAAIKKIKGKINNAMYVGYGAYYNKPLLTEMAEKLGAMLIHSSMIPEYTNSITKLMDFSNNSEPKEEIDPLINKALAIFTVTDQGVVIYAPDDDGKLYVSPQAGKASYVYYLTDKAPKKAWTEVTSKSIDFVNNKDRLSKAIYASALVMTQQTKTDVALEVVGSVGDKAIVDGLSNAFQVEEYGRVETSILNAIQDVSGRFTNGRDTKYLPPADAFCAYDLLSMLVNDEKAAFFPYHEKFTYEKIGVATHARDGFAKFTADKSAKCPFSTLTWHDSRLNLSVQTKIDGTVDLLPVDGVSPEDAGFKNPYSSFVFRNYTFIKDAHVHTPKFYITSSDKTYKFLKNKGIVIDDTFSKDGTYGLDISTLPVINRDIARSKTSGKEFAKAALEEQHLKAQIKALKWLRDELEVAKPEKPIELTNVQVLFLKENGVLAERGGLYQPPVDKQEALDYYMAKTFEIKLSGIDTLPAVKKVSEKIASGKDRTAVESLIEEGLAMWDKVKKTLRDSKMISKWFDDTIRGLQADLKEIRQGLQKQKFAILLGKAWFQEFSSRENCELTVDNVKCRFVLGEEKVAY